MAWNRGKQERHSTKPKRQWSKDWGNFGKAMDELKGLPSGPPK
jgi:hypothetical protein